ncbi:MAG: GNAT family N-acetyltransferase [Microscillaceae bacterium]|nr:GNAT family N-acetyltransferase [Microscillaceae bacterium]
MIIFGMLHTHTDFTFRWLTIEDLDLLLKYRLEFLREIHPPENPEDEDLLEEQLKAYFEKAIPAQIFWSIIAEYQGEPMAFGAMLMYDRPGTFVNISGKEAYVMNIYTLPAGRSRGLATILLQKLIEKARELGIARMNLLATAQGINIYKKMGFQKSEYPFLELKMSNCLGTFELNR